MGPDSLFRSLPYQRRLLSVPRFTPNLLKTKPENIRPSRDRHSGLFYHGAIEATMKLILALAAAAALHAQSTAPKFEVASIKACASADSGGRRGAGGSPSTPSPDRLDLNCSTVENLIQRAFADGKTAIPVTGGPPWMQSDRYRIEAKAESAQTPEMLNGPMLQALLADRFQLKIRRESREVPVYEMRVAKGGSKLRPSTEGSCEPDVAKIRAARAAGKTPPPACGIFFGRKKDAPGIVSMNTRGMTLASFAENLGHLLDRPVVDRTGIAGTFELYAEFVPDGSTPGLLGRALFAVPEGVAPEPGPAIVPALQQQLGLKLEPAKGPREFLVVDHVERPSEN